MVMMMMMINCSSISETVPDEVVVTTDH